MESARSTPVSSRNVLMLLGLAGVIGLVALRFFFLTPESDASGTFRLRNFLRLGLMAPSKLDAAFADADNDLVADTPTDPAKQIDPETLVFSVLGSDADKENEQFAEFVSHLSKVTGKKVELTIWPDSIEEQMKALRSGALHIAAVSTGSVATAVNSGGAVPFCVMAGDDGKFGYAMELIVPAQSTAKSPTDLRGKSISFVSPYSHSGFKAPVVLLWKEFNLQPGRDYDPSIEGSQEMVAQGVAKGRLIAGPIASDFLKRMIAQKEIDADKIRSIYKSELFPPACFVYAHQLKPELANQIKSAFLDFSWKGTALEKTYAPAGQTRFAPVTYQTDWARVRAMESDAVKLLSSDAR